MRQRQHAGIFRSNPGVYFGSVWAGNTHRNTHTDERTCRVSPFLFTSSLALNALTALLCISSDSPGSFSSSRLRLLSFLSAVWHQHQSEGSGLEDLNSSSAAAGRRWSARKTRGDGGDVRGRQRRQRLRKTAPGKGVKYFFFLFICVSRGEIYAWQQAAESSLPHVFAYCCGCHNCIKFVAPLSACRTNHYRCGPSFRSWCFVLLKIFNLKYMGNFFMGGVTSSTLVPYLVLLRVGSSIALAS